MGVCLKENSHADLNTWQPPGGGGGGEGTEGKKSGVAFVGEQASLPLKTVSRDFPGGPVVKTPCFHCRGHRFHPSLGQ